MVADTTPKITEKISRKKANKGEQSFWQEWVFVMYNLEKRSIKIESKKRLKKQVEQIVKDESQNYKLQSTIAKRELS